MKSTLAKTAATVAAIVLIGAPNAALALDAAERKADLDFLVDVISTKYAYLPDSHIDLSKLRAVYEPKAEAAQTPAAFLHVIEEALGELHDHHATLGSNTDASPQLIPTGTELWAQMRGGQAILTEVRGGGDAVRVGLRAGDKVLAVDGVPIAVAVARAGPKTLTAPDREADNFTLRTLLAGTHEGFRVFTIRGRNGSVREVRLPPYQPPTAKDLVTWRELTPTTGYIRIENSLGDTAAVAEFDSAVERLKGVKGLILDLRNTPSGGETNVAEPILGRFVTKTSAYQRVFDPGPGKVYPRDSWLKTVPPRAPEIKAKLVILVDHWTGSMGEGMTVGFAALHRGLIVGSAMAGLRGGTADFVLPNSRLSIHFPTEQLYQVNGQPRQTFTPPYLIDFAEAKTDDPILQRGIEVLERSLNGR